MKRMILCFAVVFAAVILSGCAATKMTSVPNGFVGSVDVAMEIGKIYLKEIYGADKVTAQEPFQALLENDQWIITGKENPYAEQMAIVLSRSSGKVVWVAPVINYAVPTRP